MSCLIFEIYFFMGNCHKNILVGLVLEVGTYFLDRCYQSPALWLFLVPRMFTKLNINDSNKKNKICHEKDVYTVER